MKSINRFLIGIFTLFLVLIVACERDLPTELEYNAYTFSDLDENGGTWSPVLLATPDTIAVAAPESVTSPSYLEELEDMKSAMASMTKSQKEAVRYWTNNPILRWNEIALELAAKYNLIPGPNEDGTYTLPNPATPEGPPPFPFANPPYTCRMLAYLSVAQYDGLISAWHYKYLYNRQAPYQVDEEIQSAYVESALPSFPSDGAVIATSSRDILTAMFPLEAEYLSALAAEHLTSLIHAGINVQSDVDAGAYIGVEAAKVAKARASTDGMRNAQTPKPISDSIKLAAFNRFGWQWDNQESPARPVGLTPLFGSVRLWNVPNVEATRPVTPPAPGSAEFEEDAAELKKFANNLTANQRKIANWWSDGLNTFTPPGHWNRFAKESIVSHSYNPLRAARTLAYMNMAIMDAGISCWDAKYYYHYPRPIQTIPGFKTILGTPNFPSYTSGHSTFSAAAADVLAYIFPEEEAKFVAWAEEAAMSRVYGGIHYRFDAEAGLEQGRAVAAYTIAVAQVDGAD